MSFIERLGIHRKSSIIESTNQISTQNNIDEQNIPLAEAEKKAILELKAQQLLEQDLSVATFNAYIDTMRELLRKRFHNENYSSFFIKEEKGVKTIEFECIAGKRSIEASFVNKEGMGRYFSTRYEELVLSSDAYKATTDGGAFAKRTMIFDIPYNIEYEVPSIVTGETVEVEFQRKKTYNLSLLETQSYLNKTFDLYKQYKSTEISQNP